MDPMTATLPERRPSARFPRFLVGADGTVIGPRGKILKTFPDRDGYRRITIYLGSGQWQQVAVHVLVAETFIGPKPSEAHMVAHGDGDHANNAVGNLRWATQLENEADKREHDRHLAGERHHQHKLTEDEVRAIRTSGERGSVLARQYGVTHTTINDIRNRKTWRHLP